MKRCIIFLRCSTEHQELESQKKETLEYAKSLGFDDFIIIGKLGASAYKVNRLYLEMLNEMYHLIETDKTIEAVVVWHLNRLARNDKVAMEIKEFLINHKMQLFVKEPSLKLMKDNGIVDDGAELIFSIFATMSKQQAAELKVKSKRGKAKNRALHKHQGGAIPFGYTVDENKFVVPDPAQAPILSEIFDLYATGEYAYPELAEEINTRYGTNIEKHSIYNFLHRKLYYDGTMYPPIITEAQFKACADERAKCSAKPSVYKHYTFANRLIKCPKCGKGYTANERKYICHKLNHCGTPTIATANLDGLLWVICSHLEGDRLLHTETKDQLLAEKAVLSQKIDGVAQYLTKGEKRAQRAKKMALDGLIEIDEYKDVLKEVEKDQKDTQKKVEHWRQQMADIDKMIEEDTLSIKKILEISDHITAMDEQEMRTIVRRWIKQITFEGDIWTVDTLTRTYKAVYNCYGFPTKWKTINGNFLAVRPLKRDKDVCEFQNIKLKPTDLPYTLAWLSGSEIV
jgi:DNA invertase Pin-like site-specific DNA recombinase